jgi:hypothetical protein
MLGGYCPGALFDERYFHHQRASEIPISISIWLRQKWGWRLKNVYTGDGGINELSGALRAGMQAVHLRIPGEESPDVFRINQEGWEGLVITSLEEVLLLVDKG